MPMQPRPRAETARSVPFWALPSVRVERLSGVVVMVRACSFERTRSQGLLRTAATLVDPDLLLDRLEVLLDVRELGEHAFAVGVQEREPLHLVPVARAAQVGVRTDLADRHRGPAQAREHDDPAQVLLGVPAVARRRPRDGLEHEPVAFVVAQRVRRQARARAASATRTTGSMTAPWAKDTPGPAVPTDAGTSTRSRCGRPSADTTANSPTVLNES